MAVTLYRQVGKGRDRRYKKVNLGPGRRPADLAGPYFLRYSLQDGTRPWESVGDDLDAAIEAQKQKQAYFDALAANVPVAQDQQDIARLKITDTVYQWLSELQILKGKDQHGNGPRERASGGQHKMPAKSCAARITSSSNCRLGTCAPVNASSVFPPRQTRSWRLRSPLGAALPVSTSLPAD
jgi:hypothetical protein